MVPSPAREQIGGAPTARRTPSTSALLPPRWQRHPRGIEAFGEGLPSPSLFSTEHTMHHARSPQHMILRARSKAPVKQTAADAMRPRTCKAVRAGVVRGRVGSSSATKAVKGAFAKSAREAHREGRHVRAGWGGFCRDPADRALSWRERARSGVWQGEGQRSARAATVRDGARVGVGEDGQEQGKCQLSATNEARAEH